MPRILVTGATGFIGRHVIHHLRAEHDVVAIARNVPAVRYAGVQWIRQDLSRELDESSLPRNVDVVIHLAQSKNYRHFPKYADDIFSVNVRSTLQLLEYARRIGARRFILASSGGIYGHSDEQFSETDPPNPLDFYLGSKHCAEVVARNYSDFLVSVVLRFFFVYGPGQRGMLIPTLLHKIRNGERIAIQGDPGIRINPIFVDDAVAVFKPALELADAGIYNVSGDEEITILELVRLCERIVGREAHVECNSSVRSGALLGNNSRLKEQLGIRPRVPLERGLALTAAQRESAELV